MSGVDELAATPAELSVPASAEGTLIPLRVHLVDAATGAAWSGATRELDDVGVAAMMWSYGSVGGSSPWSGSRRPMISERPDGEAFNRLVERLRETGVRRVSRAEALDELDRLIVGAMERRPDVPIFLSGGLDSQAMALASLRLGRRPRCYTFGEAVSRDVLGARRFARATGLPHEIVPYGDWTLESFDELIYEATRGTTGLEVAHMLGGLRPVSARVPEAYIGFLGDAITGAHLPSEGPVDLGAVKRTVLPGRGKPDSAVERLYPEACAEVERRVGERWEAYAPLAPHQRHMLIDLEIRQATWIAASFGVCDRLVRCHTPLNDLELASFLLSLPEEELRGQALYRAWIRRASAPWRRSLGLLKAVDTVRGRIRRRLGKRTPLRLDWSARIDRSRGWLEASARAAPDERLRELCLASLERPDCGRGYLPTVLWAAALARACRADL